MLSQETDQEIDKFSKKLQQGWQSKIAIARNKKKVLDCFSYIK
jgi:hypothetical protein